MSNRLVNKILKPYIPAYRKPTFPMQLN